MRTKFKRSDPWKLERSAWGWSVVKHDTEGTLYPTKREAIAYIRKRTAREGGGA